MRRTLAALPLLLALAGCGGNTPAEDAYLAELQERGSQVKVDDPDEKLADGHAACDMLVDTKPADRERFAYLLERQRPFTPLTVSAAVRHLCPDLGVRRY